MKRLQSLDALRGFDMLMIIGFGPVVVSLCTVCGWGEGCLLARQFSHVEWNGLRFEDTIFPLFLFLAGVSWPFSYARQRERGLSTAAIVLRCVRRAALLSVLGFPLQVIGMNAIAIYLSYKFIPFDILAKNLFGGLAGVFPADVGALVLNVGSLSLCWLFLYFLYRQKIFLKV